MTARPPLAPAVIRVLDLVTAIAQAVVHPQGEQLVAYLIARGDEQPDVAALRTHVQASLPAYMVPHRFLFLDVYPLTPNGKVDRKALPDPAKFALNAGSYVPPRSPIWKGDLVWKGGDRHANRGVGATGLNRCRCLRANPD